MINLLRLTCISILISPSLISCAISQKEWGNNTQKAHFKPVFYQRGLASYYAASFKGAQTYNGEHYDPNLLTAASNTLPINTYVMVKSVSSGRFVIVRINDKGPFVEGRVIDLSEIAAKKIGILEKGVGEVDIYKVESLILR